MHDLTSVIYLSSTSNHIHILTNITVNFCILDTSVTKCNAILRPELAKIFDFFHIVDGKRNRGVRISIDFNFLYSIEEIRPLYLYHIEKIW